MSPRSYTAALDGVLKPEGFVRDGKWWWRRERNGHLDEVNLQKSFIAGVTVNLYTKDLGIEVILRQVPGLGPYMAQGGTRIGHLMDGTDRWWLRDPNGPNEVAEAVKTLGLPYFERWRTLKAQAERFGRGIKWPWSGSREYLAITLYRMGEIEEACEALSNPPRLMSDKRRAGVEALRRWLGCPEIAAAPTDKPHTG